MGYCCDCTYWDESSQYCAKHGYSSNGSDSCGSFTDKGGGCYITTALCDVLGYADDCSIMTSLRQFRDKHMRGNEKYNSLLNEYDVVGPQIASAIAHDSDNHGLCLYLLKVFFNPIVEQLGKKNYSLAVEAYKKMVSFLKERYSL